MGGPTAGAVSLQGAVFLDLLDLARVTVPNDPVVRMPLRNRVFEHLVNERLPAWCVWHVVAEVADAVGNLEQHLVSACQLVGGERRRWKLVIAECRETVVPVSQILIDLLVGQLPDADAATVDVDVPAQILETLSHVRHHIVPVVRNTEFKYAASS